MFAYIRKFFKANPLFALSFGLILGVIVDTFLGCWVNSNQWTALFVVVGFIFTIGGIVAFAFACEKFEEFE